MFALVDGNNFFVSCELVFRPTLAGRPMVVLSNNDGCVIARSPEAKALGIAMGAPWYKLKPDAERQGLLAFSSNPGLYADMSNRMMNVLSQFAPAQEIYSIDECFLDLTGLSQNNLLDYAQQMRQRVAHWLGLPVCVGIASTKTLAKLANHCAKAGLSGGMGVCSFVQLGDKDRNALFAHLPVGEVWGVGRKLCAQLQARGIHTVADLCRADIHQMQRQFSIVVANIVRELNGIPCLAYSDVDDGKQQLISSRSFGQPIYALRDLQEAVASHIATAAVKLRAQGSWAGIVHVYIRTNPHTPGTFYQQGLNVPLREASNDTLRLTRAALWGLSRIYRPGLAYQKAGVALLALSSHTPQADLFTARRDDPRLMPVLDQINAKFGPGSLRSAATALRANPPWQARRNYPALGFTTQWHEILRVQAH